MRKVGLVVALMLVSAVSSAQIRRPPPPGNVRVTDIRAVDALRGSFVFEWTPAVWVYTPQWVILRRYVVSSNCEYEGLPSGGTVSKSLVGAQYAFTGPPYRARAVCDCKRPGPFVILTEEPIHIDPYAGRSASVFLVQRVPCATPDGR